MLTDNKGRLKLSARELKKQGKETLSLLLEIFHYRILRYLVRCDMEGRWGSNKGWVDTRTGKIAVSNMWSHSKRKN